MKQEGMEGKEGDAGLDSVRVIFIFILMLLVFFVLVQVIVYPTKESMKQVGAAIGLLSVWVISFLMASPALLFQVLDAYPPLKHEFPDFFLYNCIEVTNAVMAVSLGIAIETSLGPIYPSVYALVHLAIRRRDGHASIQLSIRLQIAHLLIFLIAHSPVFSLNSPHPDTHSSTQMFFRSPVSFGQFVLR